MSAVSPASARSSRRCCSSATFSGGTAAVPGGAGAFSTRYLPGTVVRELAQLRLARLAFPAPPLCASSSFAVAAFARRAVRALAHASYRRCSRRPGRSPRIAEALHKVPAAMPDGSSLCKAQVWLYVYSSLESAALHVIQLQESTSRPVNMEHAQAPAHWRQAINQAPV